MSFLGIMLCSVGSNGMLLQILIAWTRYLASDSNQVAAFCNQGFGNSHNACITSRVKQKRSQKRSKSCFWPFDIAGHASVNHSLCTRKLVKLKSLETCWKFESLGLAKAETMALGPCCSWARTWERGPCVRSLTQNLVLPDARIFRNLVRS